MKFDKYSLTGRVFPAIISMIIPIVVFNYFYASEEFSALIGEIMGAKLVANLTLPVICLFVLSQFGRVLGKNLFENLYFKDERLMPTTQFLLFSDKNFSEQHKLKIRNKMEKDFTTELLSKEEEAKDIEESKTRLVETMALVRRSLHKNEFLLQHNIEYGFMRNLIGGSVIGALICIFNILFFNNFVINELASNISIFALFFYVVLILLSKKIINFYGKRYAKILFAEYLGQK